MLRSYLFSLSNSSFSGFLLLRSLVKMICWAYVFFLVTVLHIYESFLKFVFTSSLCNWLATYRNRAICTSSSFCTSVLYPISMYTFSIHDFSWYWLLVELQHNSFYGSVPRSFSGKWLTMSVTEYLNKEKLKGLSFMKIRINTYS